MAGTTAIWGDTFIPSVFNVFLASWGFVFSFGNYLGESCISLFMLMLAVSSLLLTSSSFSLSLCSGTWSSLVAWWLLNSLCFLEFFQSIIRATNCPLSASCLRVQRLVMLCQWPVPSLPTTCTVKTTLSLEALGNVCWLVWL